MAITQVDIASIVCIRLVLCIENRIYKRVFFIAILKPVRFGIYDADTSVALALLGRSQLTSS